MSTSSTFGERFGFACWLYLLRTLRPVSYAALGKVAGRSGAAVKAWLRFEEAPPDWKLQQPTADYLGVSKEWLFQNAAATPEKVLWGIWLKERRKPKLSRVKRALAAVDGALAPASRQLDDEAAVRHRSGKKNRI